MVCNVPVGIDRESNEATIISLSAKASVRECAGSYIQTANHPHDKILDFLEDHSDSRRSQIDQSDRHRHQHVETGGGRMTRIRGRQILGQPSGSILALCFFRVWAFACVLGMRLVAPLTQNLPREGMDASPS